MGSVEGRVWTMLRKDWAVLWDDEWAVLKGEWA